MSTRILTPEQFADGGTIDGNRIERATADVVDRFNAIPAGDLERRFTQSQIVAGYLPNPAGTTALPFMWHINLPSLAAGAAPESVQNSRRVKGIYQHEEADFWIWTVSAYFKEPVVLVEVSAILLSDDQVVYPNPWVYAPAPGQPPGKTGGAPVSDVALVVSVDNPWRTEDRALDAVEVGRHRFRASAEEFSHIIPNVVVPVADMAPAFPSGEPRGLHIHARDLNLPVHRDARVRLALALPDWSGGEAPWGSAPWAQQYSSVVLTVLEEIRP